MIFEANIQGIPFTQGSHSATVIGGKARVFQSNSTKHRAWRKALETQFGVMVALSPVCPLLGPLKLDIKFRLPRLASHPKTDKGAQPVCDKSLDLDKLVRAVGDALEKSGVMLNDAQFTVIIASKRYAFPHEAPGCFLRIDPME